VALERLQRRRLAGRDKDMLDATGVARRHAERLDIAYLEQMLRPICELAEDMAPWNRLQNVLSRAGKE
jgi:hypothetical protein